MGYRGGSVSDGPGQAGHKATPRRAPQWLATRRGDGRFHAFKKGAWLLGKPGQVDLKFVIQNRYRIPTLTV